MTVLRLGTRGSALALAQANEVARRLGGDVELVTITTAGDIDRARGDKSRWVGALEAALLAGEIDLAVHSAKDVPGELAPGTVIAATPPRATPFDVLVGAPPPRGAPTAAARDAAPVPTRDAPPAPAGALAALPFGARVGTSALRRRAQLLAARPDLDVRELRGNVDTRLAKRAAGEVDALVLAAAGLERLGRSGEAGAVLRDAVFVPAAGQGVIAIQALDGSAAGRAAARADDPATHAALDAERHVVAALGADCHTPVGVLAADGVVRAFVGLPDGSEHLLEQAADADALIARLLAAGATDLLAAVAR